MARKTPADEVYRKVLVRMWRSGSFMRLSPMEPSGQGLWCFLLTCPDSTALPGAIVSGRAGMAEALRWNLRDFDRCFAEIAKEGMARADFRARLIWLPNAMMINPPANPNVLQSWGERFALLPDCRLKDEILVEIGSFVEGLGKAFMEAFRKGFQEVLREGSSKGLGNTFQETGSSKQEAGTVGKDKDKPPADAGSPVAETGPEPVQEELELTPPTAGPVNGSEFERWWTLYRDRTGRGTDKVETRHAYDRLSMADKLALFDRTVKWFGTRAAIEVTGVFVAPAPDPKRFIKNRRWEDELSTPKKGRPRDATGAVVPDSKEFAEDGVEVDEQGVERYLRRWRSRATGEVVRRRWGKPTGTAGGGDGGERDEVQAD